MFWSMTEWNSLYNNSKEGNSFQKLFPEIISKLKKLNYSNLKLTQPFEVWRKSNLLSFKNVCRKGGPIFKFCGLWYITNGKHKLHALNQACVFGFCSWSHPDLLQAPVPGWSWQVGTPAVVDIWVFSILRPSQDAGLRCHFERSLKICTHIAHVHLACGIFPSLLYQGSTLSHANAQYSVINF